MHLDSLALENFQGFHGYQSVEAAPLTVIFGPNASGKSSIGRSLKLLKQSANSGLAGFLYRGDQIDLKTRNYVTFGMDPEADMGAGLSVELDPTNIENFGVDSIGLVKHAANSGSRLTIFVHAVGQFDQAELNYSFDLVFNEEGVGPTSFSVVDRQAAELHFKQILGSDEMIRKLTFIDESYDVYLDSEGVQWSGHLDDDSEQFWESSTGLVVSKLDVDAMTWIRNPRIDLFREAASASSWAELLDDPGSQFESDGRGSIEAQITATHEVTGAVERVKVLNKLRELAVNSCMAYLEGLAFTTSIRPIQEEISSTNVDKPTEQINRWLGELTEQRYSVVIESEPAFDRLFTSTTILDSLTGAEVNFENVGAGLSQILPILEALAKRPNALLIEQPELHLHPRMQADLADVFIQALQAEGGPSQLFVETHSENILLRIQRRIRDGTLSAESVRIIYCEPESDLIGLSDLVSFGNDHDQVAAGFAKIFQQSPSAVEDKNFYIPLPLETIRKFSLALDLDLKLPDPKPLGNTMANLALDSAGDVLDPFPVSFVDLRLTDLL